MFPGRVRFRAEMDFFKQTLKEVADKASGVIGSIAVTRDKS